MNNFFFVTIVHALELQFYELAPQNVVFGGATLQGIGLLITAECEAFFFTTSTS